MSARNRALTQISQLLIVCMLLAACVATPLPSTPTIIQASLTPTSLVTQAPSETPSLTPASSSTPPPAEIHFAVIGDFGRATRPRRMSPRWCMVGTRISSSRSEIIITHWGRHPRSTTASVSTITISFSPIRANSARARPRTASFRRSAITTGIRTGRSPTWIISACRATSATTISSGDRCTSSRWTAKRTSRMAFA